jgi:hypothetical protein
MMRKSAITMSTAAARSVNVRTRATLTACFASGSKTRSGGEDGASGLSPGRCGCCCWLEPLNSNLSLNHIAASRLCQQPQLLDFIRSSAILDSTMTTQHKTGRGDHIA